MAHFPSRDVLLDAVAGRAAAEVAAVFEAAGLQDAPPAGALIGLLDSGWAVSARYRLPLAPARGEPGPGPRPARPGCLPAA